MKQAATASLEPGKSTGADQKTTADQEWAHFRMVHENCFKIARALTERIRNLYGVRVGRKTINSWLVARGFLFYRGAKWPLLLLDRNVNGVVYQDILQETLVQLAMQHIGDDSAMLHFFQGSDWLSAARGHN